MMQQSLYKQRGLSLISLFIAMAIGIFLVGGVVKIYANSKSSFNTRNAVADVAEIQRFAIDDMRRILVMAGRNITGTEDQSTTTATFPPLGVGAGRIVDGGVGGSDTIAIRYRRGPSCGAYLNIPTTQPAAMVRFFVDGNNQLICELTNAGGVAVNTVVATNVFYLKALYGIDTDVANPDGYADTYETAAQVNARAAPPGSSSPWSRVVSIRVGILAGSVATLPRDARVTAAELSLPGDPPGTPPNVLGIPTPAGWPLGWPPEVDGSPLISRIYKVASTTVALRNLNPTIAR
jgi:type IV pilus assembly protein PilW